MKILKRVYEGWFWYCYSDYMVNTILVFTLAITLVLIFKFGSIIYWVAGFSFLCIIITRMKFSISFLKKVLRVKRRFGIAKVLVLSLVCLFYGFSLSVSLLFGIGGVTRPIFILGFASVFFVLLLNKVFEGFLDYE